MKITKTASFFFSFSFPDFDSSTFGLKGGAVVISITLKTGANRQTSALKRTKKKIYVLRFIASISKKMTILVHVENVSFGIANQ